MNDVYNTYLALKLHFTTDKYDIVKYGGKVKSGMRNSKIEAPLGVFVRKYKKYDFVEFLVSNFINGDRHGGIFDPLGEKVYNKWRERTQNLTYHFKNDINTIISSLKGKPFETAFESNGQHPLIMKLYMGGHVSLETIVIINIIHNFISILDERLKDDTMWSKFRKLVTKYQPFLSIDVEKYENIIKNQPK